MTTHCSIQLVFGNDRGYFSDHKNQCGRVKYIAPKAIYYTGSPLPAPKQLCELAQFGSTYPCSGYFLVSLYLENVKVY